MPADRKSDIAAAFAQLARRGSIDKITVKALIEACHISRQTFYYHFQDIMDVVEWSIRQAMGRLVEESLKARDLGAVMKIFVAFAVEHFPMLRKLMESQRRGQVEQLMIHGMMAYLGELARHSPRDIPASYGDREVLLRFNAWGLAGVLLDYCGRPDLDQERLAAQLGRILTGEAAGWGQG